MMYVRKIVPILIAAMFVGLAFLAFGTTLQQTSKQNLTGELRVKPKPEVKNVWLFYDDNGGQTSPSTELTPNDEMTLIIELNFSDSGGYIHNLTVIFYFDGTDYSGNPVTVDSSDNPAFHATYVWDNATGNWTVSPSPSTWAIDYQNSSGPADLGVNISGLKNITLVFTPGKTARFTTLGNWTIFVEVTDQDNPDLLYGTYNQTGYDCRFYLEMSIDATAFSFGHVPPGCENVSFNYTGGINITMITNDYWNITFNATGWYDGGVLVVNFSEFNSLLVDDDPVALEATETGLNPMWIKPSGVTWGSLQPPVDDINGRILRIWLFVTLPSDIPPGHYTTTLSITTSQA